MLAVSLIPITVGFILIETDSAACKTVQRKIDKTAFRIGILPVCIVYTLFNIFFFFASPLGRT